MYIFLVRLPKYSTGAKLYFRFSTFKSTGANAHGVSGRGAYQTAWEQPTCWKSDIFGAGTILLRYEDGSTSTECPLPWVEVSFKLSISAVKLSDIVFSLLAPKLVRSSLCLDSLSSASELCRTPSLIGWSAAKPVNDLSLKYNNHYIHH